MSHHEHLTYCTLCFTTWAAARVVFCHFQMVIWRLCWIFVPVGLEALKILKMLELRANQCETDLDPCTGVSVNQPQRGDYTGSPPFWPVGEIDLSSSWPQCIIFAVKSVSWFVFSTLKLTRVFKHSVQRPHETARWHVSTLLYAHLHWAASIWPNMSAVVLLPLHYQISANDTFTQSNKGSCFLIRVQRSLVSKYALSSLHSSF